MRLAKYDSCRNVRGLSVINPDSDLAGTYLLSPRKDLEIRGALFEQERMSLLSRFAFRADPDCPQAAYRTFVLADAAARASLGVHLGRLKPDLQFDLFQVGCLKFGWNSRFQDDQFMGIRKNSRSRMNAAAFNQYEEVARTELSG